MHGMWACFMSPPPIAGLGVLPPLHTVPSLLPSWAGISGIPKQQSHHLNRLQQQPIPHNGVQQRLWVTICPMQQPSTSHEALVASLYLGDGVVPVPDKLLKRIWALEFIEMSQLLPEAWVQDAFAESSSHCCHDARSNKPIRKGVTSIFSWIQCYSTLVSVLAHKFPAKVPQLMAYQSVIVRCYTDYEGDSWLAYDRAFRRKAAQKIAVTVCLCKY